MDVRLKVYQILIIILFLLLIGRAAHLQIYSGDYYQELSEGNRISMRPINAPQGKILTKTNANSDNNTKVLVSNKLSYNIYLLPNEIPEDLSVTKLLKKLVELVDFNKTNLKKIEGYPSQLNNSEKKENKLELKSDLTEKQELELLKSNYKNNKKEDSGSFPVLLKKYITSENMLIIEENRDLLPGILVKESTIRHYEYNDLACHVLEGLERKYNKYLKGVDGLKQIEVNNVGKKVRTLGIKPPQTGHNLILNLKIKKKKKTESLLKNRLKVLRKKAEEDEELTTPTGAAAVVLDPKTGAVLSISSIPGYNLNFFAKGISSENFQKLKNNKFKPLFNRTIMAAVPPGSIFKLVTGTAAIEELGVEADSTFYDRNAEFTQPQWETTFKNWYPHGEGKLTFTRAIARSNNIVFYKLGYRLYKKYQGSKLVQYAKQFGLGSKTGIDLPNEKPGLVPTGEWKKEHIGHGWLPGDSINLSIGQGDLKATPIQIAEIVSAIANQGQMYRPYLVDKIVSKNGDIIKDKQPQIRKKLKVDKKVFKILKSGMSQVTQSEGGTASSVFGDFPVEVAGKTGTAQTSISNANHGWFAGFSPVKDPEIVVLVFIENGYSSINTLPVAAGIFRTYFDMKKETDVNTKKLSNNIFMNMNNIFDKKSDSPYILFDFFRKAFSRK